MSIDSVCILGLGNVKSSDDAAGPYLLEVLEANYDFPRAVHLFEAGTPGIDLLPPIMGLDALIVLDTLRGGGAPGEVRTFSRAAILKGSLPRGMGPHESGLRDALLGAELRGSAPREALFIGVIPENVGAGVEMSEDVLAAMPVMEAEVLKELERLRCPARKKQMPKTPDIWWQRSAEA